MSKVPIVGVLLLVSLATAAEAAGGPGIEPDHVWIMVSLNAPERAGLERAGFEISKEINHHPGTGTSSVTVEFENGYLGANVARSERSCSSWHGADSREVASTHALENQRLVPARHWVSTHHAVEFPFTISAVDLDR